MMNQLDISEGDFVIVDNATLQLATYSKFQPQSIEFLDISNPKAVYPSIFSFEYFPVSDSLPKYLIPQCVHACIVLKPLTRISKLGK